MNRGGQISIDMGVHEPIAAEHSSVVVDPLYFASEAVEAIASLLFECELLTALRSDALFELSTSSGCFPITATATPFGLDHGLYIVLSGQLRCHIGSLSFELGRGEFAGEHSLTQTLAGIAPTFTAAANSALLHVPTPVVHFLAASCPALEEALQTGPLFQALVQAAEQGN